MGMINAPLKSVLHRLETIIALVFCTTACVTVGMRAKSAHVCVWCFAWIWMWPETWNARAAADFFHRRWCFMLNVKMSAPVSGTTVLQLGYLYTHWAHSANISCHLDYYRNAFSVSIARERYCSAFIFFLLCRERPLWKGTVFILSLHFCCCWALILFSCRAVESLLFYLIDRSKSARLY